VRKQAQGRLGERIFGAYFRQVVGVKGVVVANADETNFPVDLLFKGGTVEVKAGNIGNKKGSQQWRVTLGGAGATEKAYMETLSGKALRAYNDKRETDAINRKLAVMKELQKINGGRKQEALTATLIINMDTHTADIFVFDGFHKKIGWNTAETAAAYVGTVSWTEKEP
jgi:hypothetical protein